MAWLGSLVPGGSILAWLGSLVPGGSIQIAALIRIGLLTPSHARPHQLNMMLGSLIHVSIYVSS